MTLTFEELVKEKKRFTQERDWDKFLKPKDILLALMGEVGELAQLHRWLTPKEIEKIYANKEKREAIEHEVADIFSFLIMFCNATNIDLLKAAQRKLEKNKLKYPLEKAKGVHTNPLEGCRD